MKARDVRSKGRVMIYYLEGRTGLEVMIFKLDARTPKSASYSDFQNVIFNYKVGKEYLFRKGDRMLSMDLLDPNSAL